MRYLSSLLVVVLMLAGCSSSGSTVTGASSSGADNSPSSGAGVGDSSGSACALKSSGQDVIYWMKTPGQEPIAQELGDVNYATCSYSYDQATLDHMSPPGAGFCTKVAMVADNPAYNVDATPALPLKNVLAESGAGC